MGPGPLASQSLVLQLGRATLGLNFLPPRCLGVALTLFSPSCKRQPCAVFAQSPGSRNCLKGTCHLQGSKIRGAWARSCSNGGRGGLKNSWHSREDHTALNASSVQESRGQNSDGMAETRDAESHPSTGLGSLASYPRAQWLGEPLPDHSPILPLCKQ